MSKRAKVPADIGKKGMRNLYKRGYCVSCCREVPDMYSIGAAKLTTGSNFVVKSTDVCRVACASSQQENTVIGTPECISFKFKLACASALIKARLGLGFAFWSVGRSASSPPFRSVLSERRFLIFLAGF